MKTNFFLFLFIFSPLLSAQPIVIYDSGKTFSMQRYLVRVSPKEITKPPPRPKKPSANAVSVFPVTTNSLTVGKVQAQSVDLSHLARPLFIIGDDPVSTQWLIQFRQRLIDINAAGIVVNVKTALAMRDLQQIAQGLELHPLAGGQLSQDLGITHYPVLITQTVIEQ